MSIKAIEAVYPPGPAHFVGDGFRVHNFIPSRHGLDMHRMSPFIMMDYGAKFQVPPSDAPKGVGVHPHRGFETVTIAYKGRVAHHDSAGGGGIIGEGDVQWMTAASGVLHKEYHEETFSKSGGDFQMIQLWVNLPAKDKMSAPKYQAIENASMPKVAVEKGYVEVIAGNFQSVQGKASTFTPVHMFNAHLDAGGKSEFEFPAEFNACLVVVEGEIRVNGSDEAVPLDHFVLFENEGETFHIEAIVNSKVLILSGEPIREPIASHGPFVMNSRHEILQAFQDFEDGKFGQLS
jgi:redox-sensitive bicupin YhaK (pirin superfamily)